MKKKVYIGFLILMIAVFATACFHQEERDVVAETMKSIQRERDTDFMMLKGDVMEAWDLSIDQICEEVSMKLQEEVNYDASKVDNTAKNVKYIMNHFTALTEDLGEDALMVYLYYRGTFTKQYHIPTALMENVLEFLGHTGRENIATKMERRHGVMVGIELHKRRLDDIF